MHESRTHLKTRICYCVSCTLARAWVCVYFAHMMCMCMCTIHSLCAHAVAVSCGVAACLCVCDVRLLWCATTPPRRIRVHFICIYMFVWLWFCVCVRVCLRVYGYSRKLRPQIVKDKKRRDTKPCNVFRTRGFICMFVCVLLSRRPQTAPAYRCVVLRCVVCARCVRPPCCCCWPVSRLERRGRVRAVVYDHLPLIYTQILYIRVYIPNEHIRTHSCTYRYTYSRCRYIHTYICMMFHSCDSRDYICTYSQIHVYIFEEDDKGGIQIIVMTALFMYTKDKVQGI